MRTREERIAMIRAARAEAERKRRKRERYCDCTGSGPDAACTGRCNPNVPDDDFEEAFGDPPGEPPEHDLEM